MRGIRILVALVMIPLLVSGCAITQDFKVASGIKDAKTVNIITNAETKEGFLEAMKTWLEENGYEYNVLADGSSTKQDGWALTYNGLWSWDLTIYMSKAFIKAYENGVLAGESKYSVQGGASSMNLGKFKKAEETVWALMSKLFYGKEK